MKESRARRVGELVREEIAALLSRGLKDPRIGFVSVMEVRMSPDLKYADVFVSLFGNDSQKRSSMAGLRSSAGWIRREVGQRLKLRFAPEIRFREDTTLDQAFHLEEVLRSVHAESNSAETAEPGTSDPEGTSDQERDEEEDEPR